MRRGAQGRSGACAGQGEWMGGATCCACCCACLQAAPSERQVSVVDTANWATDLSILQPPARAGEDALGRASMDVITARQQLRRAVGPGVGLAGLTGCLKAKLLLRLCCLCDGWLQAVPSRLLSRAGGGVAAMQRRATERGRSTQRSTVIKCVSQEQTVQGKTQTVHLFAEHPPPCSSSSRAPLAAVQAL